MVQFYTYTLFDGTSLNSSCDYTTTDGHNVYCSFSIAKIITKTNTSGTTNSSFITVSYSPTGLIAVSDFLFVIGNGYLYYYLLSDGSYVNNINLNSIQNPNSAYSINITSDWDGSSSTFKLFVVNSRDGIIQFLSYSGGLTIGTTYNTWSGPGDPTIINSITYRRSSSSHKYLYVTSKSAFIKQIDISNPILFSTTTITTTGINTWSIINNNDIFYIGVYDGGFYELTINEHNGATDSIISFNTATEVLVGGGPTIIINDTISTSRGQQSRLISTSNNVKIYGINIYIGTNDSQLIKLYPSGGYGVGGDPHFKPLFGSTYTLDNNVQFVKIFENNFESDSNKDEKIVIIGENWILPRSEIQKFKSNRAICQLLKKYTFIKNIMISFNDNIITLNMDTLEYTCSNNTNILKNIRISDIAKTKSMFCIRKEQLIYDNDCNERIINIHNNTFNMTLFISNCLNHRDRNSITINIDSNEINKNKFTGALIYESEENTISLFADTNKEIDITPLKRRLFK